MERNSYLKALGRQWPLIAACVLVAITAASLLSLRMAPQYVSTAQLFVSAPQGGGGDAYTGMRASKQRATAYADLAGGEELAQRVIDRLDLDDSPQAVAEQVGASVVPGSVVLNVSVSDAHPERARFLAEIVSEEFAAFAAELETDVGRRSPNARVTIIDPPGAPESRSTAPWVRNIGLATVLGLLLGIGLAALRAPRGTTARSA